MNENMLPVGTVLRAKTYRIEKQIGAGGFGKTYMVTNLNFNEVYAMKEFFMKDINLRTGSEVTVSIPSQKSTFEAQRNKFKKEAIRLRKLNNDHIVKVHDLFDENGTVYYVMNLIDGQSLCDLVKEKGLMGEEDALDVSYQILDALSVVHSQEPQMLHLDIKPSNIMVDKSGKAYLLDFGSSKQVDTDHNMTSSAFTLTPGYAPSELIDGNKSRIGPWTDLYELGATLYHVLTGHQPPTISEITEDGDDAFIFPETVSEKTRKLIYWLMSLSRTKRPKSVEEILSKIGNDDGKPIGPVKPIKIVPPTGNRGNDDDKTILNISGTNTIKYIGNNPIIKKLTDNMVYVEGGAFTMGATPEQGREAEIDERSAHNVNLSSFYIGRFEVTQEEWETVMGNNPSYHKGPKRPVENVSWNDCQAFLRKLNGMTGKSFRLPTEAEWEYAARGGKFSKGYKYIGGENVESFAWYDGNSNNVTHPVGQKSPNELGLYDMSGNVCEWCGDIYESVYPCKFLNNPTGASSGQSRVLRGGSFHSGTRHCRVSYRNYCPPYSRNSNIGLRLVL